MAIGAARSPGLIDTNVVVLLPQLNRDHLPIELLISTITLAELSVGPLVAMQESERALRQLVLQQVEAQFSPVPFDGAAARAFGVVAAALHRAGRKVAARTFDAMIAATAMSLDVALYTCNPSDFQAIDGLLVVGVPHPNA